MLPAVESWEGFEPSSLDEAAVRVRGDELDAGRLGSGSDGG